MADRWQIVLCGSCTAMEICWEPLWLLPVRLAHASIRIQRQGVEIYKRPECAADMWPKTCFLTHFESFGTFWNPFSCSLRMFKAIPAYNPCLQGEVLGGGPVSPHRWTVQDVLVTPWDLPTAKVQLGIWHLCRIRKWCTHFTPGQRFGHLLCNECSGPGALIRN